MEYQPQHTDSKNNLVNESKIVYQNTSTENTHQLEDALERSDMDKFQFLMKLIKTQRTMQKMSITHKD